MTKVAFSCHVNVNATKGNVTAHFQLFLARQASRSRPTFSAECSCCGLTIGPLHLSLLAWFGELAMASKARGWIFKHQPGTLAEQWRLCGLIIPDPLQTVTAASAPKNQRHAVWKALDGAITVNCLRFLFPLQLLMLHFDVVWSDGELISCFSRKIGLATGINGATAFSSLIVAFRRM